MRDQPEVLREAREELVEAVVYRASEDRLVIVAFAHQKRQPGYWRHR